jgi:hypothetical protein
MQAKIEILPFQNEKYYTLIIEWALLSLGVFRLFVENTILVQNQTVKQRLRWKYTVVPCFPAFTLFSCHVPSSTQASEGVNGSGAKQVCK